ncbi:hypothetical protein LTR85_000221 [Meristemomyces frigidus]|nr:hypothetical protein LTR85_000221 [Meristemomyces frigidus]
MSTESVAASALDPTANSKDLLIAEVIAQTDSSAAVAAVIDVGLLDEETLPRYQESRYYPVRIGDVLDDRYEVLGKLGYSATSTTWLCHDDEDEDYKTVKVCIHESGITLREQEAYDHMAGMSTRNPGLFHLRQVKDDFDLTGPTGHEHHCFVFEPAACNIAQLTERIDGECNLGLVKWIVRSTLRALDFLHSDAHIIHTDVKPDNIMLSLEDQDVLEEYVATLSSDPPRQKTTESGRVIYESRELKDLGQSRWRLPILTDLGEARIVTDDGEMGLQRPAVVSPPAMRAPESILGCMFFMLVNGDLLFHNKTGEKAWSGCWHLAQMVALIGRPSPDFLERSEKQTVNCDGSCAWQDAAGKGLPDMSFEALLNKLGGEECVRALDFVRCIFKWKPEEWSSVKALIAHPFLRTEDEQAESEKRESLVAQAGEVAEDSDEVVREHDKEKMGAVAEKEQEKGAGAKTLTESDFLANGHHSEMAECGETTNSDKAVEADLAALKM